MFIILEQFGKDWGIPYRTPHSGPYPTVEEAEAEIKRYFERWEEDTNTFGIFSITQVK